MMFVTFLEAKRHGFKSDTVQALVSDPS